MAIRPLIYATTDEELTTEELLRLRKNLIGQLGCFEDFDEEFAVRFWTDERSISRLEIDNLPKSKIVIEVWPDLDYYGPRYERGNWPELAAILEFLRRQVLQSKVWYGGDCDIEVSLVTSEWLDEMWQYWSINGNRPYRDKFPSSTS